MFGLIRNKAFFLVLLLMQIQLGSAQRIINYNLNSSGGIVRIDFDVAKGSTCNGYSIYHSTDSTFFTIIEDFAGICSDTYEMFQIALIILVLVQMLLYYKVELAL